MASPGQKLVLAPGAIFTGNTAVKIAGSTTESKDQYRLSVSLKAIFNGNYRYIITKIIDVKSHL